MASLLLPILAGSFGPGYCFPANPDQVLLDIANNLQAVLANGRSYYNVGDTKPTPDLQAYPWLNTQDNRWYVFNGVWRAPNNYSVFDRRLFAGSLTDLISYDGGSAGTVSPTTGPMWVEDTQAQGRVPMSPGLIPGTTAPAKTLAVLEQYGNGEVTLSDANGGVGLHTHLYGVKDPSKAAAAFALGALATVPTYSAWYIPGGGAPLPEVETTADMATLPAGPAGAGVTAAPFSIVPPVYGLYVVRPSGRLYFTVP